MRFIHISTDEVYGAILNKTSDEKKSYEPNSPYAASKAAVDHIMRSYSVTYNLPLIPWSNLLDHYILTKFGD